MARYTEKQYQILEQKILLELNDIGKRIKENHHAEFKYEKDVVDTLVTQCANTDGNIDHAIDIAKNQILADIAKKILDKIAQKQPIQIITIAHDKNSQGFNYIIS